MAAGDLITRDYQYEFNGLLMGSGTPLVVESIEGLWSMPELRTADIERNDYHGDIPGEDLLGPRSIEIELHATADSQIEMEAALLNAARTFQPRLQEVHFVWKRPGQVRKFVNCRPRKRQFPTSYEMAHGLSKGSLLLHASDPVIYALAEKNASIFLSGPTTNADGTTNPGATIGSTTWTNDGDWETWPRLILEGAGDNPRIGNGEDGNRQIRIDVIMGTNDRLVMDAHPQRRTVTLNGVDRYDLVRTDNQWWRLLEGTNTITFSRGAATGSQTLTIAGRDAWV